MSKINITTAIQTNQFKELSFSTFEFTIQTLQLKFETNKLKFDPHYQREYVWSDEKASKLVESCILRIPLPNFYFYQNKDGIYEIIDGVQRLTSILRYMSDSKIMNSEGKLQNSFKLKNLTILTELENKKYSELDNETKGKIEDYPIRCIILRSDNKDDVVREIFSRLNTGGVNLEPQEVRNALYPSFFNTILDEIGKVIKSDLTISSKEEITEVSVNDIGEETKNTFKIDRKSDEEVALRYFALLDNDNLDDYKGIAKSLDETMIKYKNITEKDAENMKKKYLETYEKCKFVFGEGIFRGQTREKPRKGICYYDIQMWGIKNLPNEKLKRNKILINEKYKEMCRDKEFTTSIASSSNTKKSIQSRRNVWKKYIIDNLK